MFIFFAGTAKAEEGNELISAQQAEAVFAVGGGGNFRVINSEFLFGDAAEQNFFIKGRLAGIVPEFVGKFAFGFVPWFDMGGKMHNRRFDIPAVCFGRFGIIVKEIQMPLVIITPGKIFYFVATGAV